MPTFNDPDYRIRFYDYRGYMLRQIENDQWTALHPVKGFLQPDLTHDLNNRAAACDEVEIQQRVNRMRTEQ